MAQISFTGNVARPEMKELGGKPAVSFSVAENHRRKDRNTDQYVDSGVTWFRVTYFGNNLLSPAALFAAINTPKAMVLVTGRQETRDYVTNDGEERSSLEVTADYAAPLQKDQGGGQQGGGYGQAQGGGYGQAQGGGYGGPPQGGGYGQPQGGGYGGQQGGYGAQADPGVWQQGGPQGAPQGGGYGGPPQGGQGGYAGGPGF